MNCMIRSQISQDYYIQEPWTWLIHLTYMWTQRTRLLLPAWKHLLIHRWIFLLPRTQHYLIIIQSSFVSACPDLLRSERNLPIKESKFWRRVKSLSNKETKISDLAMCILQSLFHVEQPATYSHDWGDMTFLPLVGQNTTTISFAVLFLPLSTFTISN